MRSLLLIQFLISWRLAYSFRGIFGHRLFIQWQSTIKRLFKPLPLPFSPATPKYRSIPIYCAPYGIISDDTYEEWVDDIIYSGDIEGYVKRRSSDLVSEDFLGYLDERVEDSTDDDEKVVLKSIIAAVVDILRRSDGLEDSDIIFEKRLDRILFTAPQRRRDLITENVDEMTPGFIEYIQNEIKNNDDVDVKVVLASILQMIGHSKNVDLLSGTVAGSLTSRIGEVLGETSSSLLAVDNSSPEATSTKYESILAGLVFSENDVIEDILNNLHYIDDEFVKYLEVKIDKTKDIEERVGLSSLLDTMQTVLTRVKDVQGDNFVDANNEELTMAQVKQRLQEFQQGREVEGKSSNMLSAKEYEVKTSKKDTFLSILKRFQNLPEAIVIDDVVKANYELCDLEFMEMLNTEIRTCLNEGADIEAREYQNIQEAINRQMVVRISSAQEKLQKILSKPSQKSMEAEIVVMARRGEVDEALVLLLEGNIQQAEEAGAKPAVELLRSLRRKMGEEKERQLPDEQKLIRALIREDDPSKRKNLLFEAFRPFKSVDDEGKIVEGAPIISPTSFINAVRRIIQEIGNVDTFKIMEKMNSIIDEAQVVATELYGEGMSPRDQQRFMFEKNTISVWDLAQFEEEADMTNREIPWKNDKYDNMNPEDVLQQKKMKSIGGIDGM